MTSNLDVRLAAPRQILDFVEVEKYLRAFISAIASLIAFFVCVLKTSVISGNGGFHFNM